MLNMTVYTLSSTNIDQSAPNLVKIYVIIRSRMSSIMDLIGSELSELSALELENLLYLTLFTLASANIDQSVPNLATILSAHKVSDEFDYGTNQNQIIQSYSHLNLEKLLKMIFSSTGQRPVSLCHGLLSVVRPSIRPCINFFFKHLLL